MNKNEIIKELENRIVTNIRQMDAHNNLKHNECAKTHATIVCELIELLATITNKTYTTIETEIFNKYNLWKF
jgi:hypothetical protein